MQFTFRLPVLPDSMDRVIGYLDFGALSDSENSTIKWITIDKSRDGWAIPVNKFSSANSSVDLGDSRAVFTTAIAYTVMPDCKNH